MALTGALTADFSDFVAEANKASAALGVMDTEAKKTGATLAKTGQAVDGFGANAGKGGDSLTKLTGGLRMVDSSLSAVGLNMSKPIGAIEELAVVATKGVGALGALGAAGAVLAGAIAAWEFGKWSGDITGMNAVWDKIWESLGVNSIAAETAAARADVFALALKRTGYAGNDLNVAMQKNADWVKDHTAAVQTATHRQAEWEREIRKHRDVLPDIDAKLAAHAGTVKELANEYKISEKALTYYLAKTKDQTAAQDEANRKTEAAAAAQEKLRASMFGTDSITKANEYVAALGGISNLTRMTAEEQTKLNTVLGEAIAAYTRTGEVAPQAMRDLYNATVSIGPVVTGLGEAFANIGTKFTVTADAIVADTQRMAAEAAAYEAETQSMAQAWQTVPPPVAAATAEVERLTVAMADFGRTNRSAWESMQAGAELMQAYQNAGIFVGLQGGAMTGYQAQQRTRMASETPTGGAAWGNTLTVNVNSTDANNIATKLVDEMRRSGVRF